MDSSILSAIHRKITALSKCFQNFIRAMATDLPEQTYDQSQKEKMNINIDNVRLIIDARHHLFSKISGCTSQKKRINYSHKLNNIALSNLFIIDNNGLCVYASKSYPSVNNDITIYGKERDEILRGLSNLFASV